MDINFAAELNYSVVQAGLIAEPQCPTELTDFEFIRVPGRELLNGVEFGQVGYVDRIDR